MKWITQFTQSPDGLLWAALSALPSAEAENLVWQRVDQFLAAATPGAQQAFLGLRKWLAQQKACPDLRFTPLPGGTTSPTGLTTASTGGLYGATTTARIFGIYMRKTTAAGSTASYFRTFDDGTDSALSGLASSARITLPLGAVPSAAPPPPGLLYESMYISPNGFPCAAGLRAALVTAPDGVTISTSTDGGDGFCITSA